jgi:glycosyltransferase involved in cell wall biosynthesis
MATGDVVTVLTRRQRGMASFGNGPLAVRRVGCWWLRGPGFLAAAAAWLLPRRKQFDVIHAHQAYWPAVIAALVRLCGGPPAVVKLAGPDLPRGPGPLTRLRRLAASRLDAVVATQPAMAVAAKEIGLQRVVLIPNGVDTADFEPDLQRGLTRAAQRVPADDQVVLFVGRLEWIKGIDLLLDAWPEVIRSCPRARLRIAGEGTLGKALRRSPPRGVEFLGCTNDTRSLYRTADVFVLPSRSEGLSNALLEAMATGLVVVATAVGGNVEVIHDGKNGVLVPARKPAALASAIVALTGDPERRRVLGDAARKTVLRSYRLEAVEKQWGELYAQLGK